MRRPQNLKSSSTCFDVYLIASKQTGDFFQIFVACSEKLNFNEEKNKTMSVGYYEKGKSDYGIYDLSGNASEWVQDWHFPEYYLFSPKENPKGPERGQYKIIRGGNWRNTAEYVDLTYRNATTPRMRNTGIGFRCAKSAPLQNLSLIHI